MKKIRNKEDSAIHVGGGGVLFILSAIFPLDLVYDRQTP